jgi:ribonucleoside-diphosphate reductase alpha chain
MRFEPAGMTDDPDIRLASSVMDYIFRRLALDFLDFDTRSELGILTSSERAAQLRAEAAGGGAGEDMDLTEMRNSAPVVTSPEKPAPEKPVARPAEVDPPRRIGSSTELLELVQGKAADAPLCFTCGTKMRPAGSCYVCEGCGSTSGCS